MNIKLEVLVVPVSGVDRAKRFYQKLVFRFGVAARRLRKRQEFVPLGVWVASLPLVAPVELEIIFEVAG